LKGGCEKDRFVWTDSAFQANSSETYFRFYTQKDLFDDTVNYSSAFSDPNLVLGKNCMYSLRAFLAKESLLNLGFILKYESYLIKV
jgi:hypothetical protein